MSRSRGLKRRTLLWSGRLRRLRKDLSSPAIPSIWLEVMRSQQKKVLINIGWKYRRFKWVEDPILNNVNNIGLDDMGFKWVVNQLVIMSIILVEKPNCHLEVNNSGWLLLLVKNCQKEVNNSGGGGDVV
jgi:hypothetical protein